MTLLPTLSYMCDEAPRKWFAARIIGLGAPTRYASGMRAPVDAEKLQRFMEALGKRCRGPGRVYLVGGATALLHGWRPMTADVDLELDPEPDGAFEAIAKLKNELDINVELAAPSHFIPEVPGWQERSVFIDLYGEVGFLHYDLVSQALAKLERGSDRDLADVRAMIAAGLVTPESVRDGFAAIESRLVRFPRIDPESYGEDVRRFLESVQ